MNAPYTTRAVCRNCDNRGDCVMIPRKVGGSYNRAARWQDCRICADCVIDLADRIQTGHTSINRWSGAGLRHMAERLLSHG